MELCSYGEKNNLFSSKLNVSNGWRAATRLQSAEQSTMPLFILARSRNSLDSRWEGRTETHKEKVAEEVTEERRDVSGKERDCRVETPSGRLHSARAPSSAYLGIWDPTVGSGSDTEHPEEVD